MGRESLDSQSGFDHSHFLSASCDLSSKNFPEPLPWTLPRASSEASILAMVIIQLTLGSRATLIPFHAQARAELVLLSWVLYCHGNCEKTKGAELKCSPLLYQLSW